ncbi:QueT transporter family protein [Peptostreptococcus porci]|uniref:QueT transporter family protein n=2 Tax=Peptostreptococcus porci TaxID=2652282 RepID=A0A6N7XHX7_9FIRM|nr:QueT transporter family protein [Peptostreptococcus porci]MDY2794367.1 QueT transporter family protein [Peptostreptococcus porci]MDY4129241.1 QueT transporter family protein [Peptostreptococcus porci]MDY4560711.1 QueT transporter family protein [Peptostreptococcus porci]MDY5436482.1 QueT transporter family protein [Peptostreptococcus porci]MDY5478976.1 QueT transporter family protein [Peptostreptococcus porci]
MKFSFDSSSIAKQAMVAALYAVLTWAIPSLSYGPIQFRVSEIMTLLAFYNPQYVIGLTVGCAIANLFSSLGAIDIFVGTLASFLALFAMSKIKNIWIASLMPALSAIIIGAEIVLVSPEPVSYFLITGQIMISELIIVTGCGVVLFKILEKNKQFSRVVLEA